MASAQRNLTASRPMAIKSRSKQGALVNEESDSPLESDDGSLFTFEGVSLPAPRESS